MPLRTWSGPQFAETKLKAELLEQLGFASVYDIMCNPAIDYSGMHADHPRAVDLVTFLITVHMNEPTRYLVEIEGGRDIDGSPVRDPDRLDAARTFASQIDASFRILGEADIRTPYLDNVRRLRARRRRTSNRMAWEINVCLTDAGPVTFARLIELLVLRGKNGRWAREAVESFIADHPTSCDLSKHLEDDSVVTLPSGHLQFAHDCIPIIRTIRLARR